MDLGVKMEQPQIIFQLNSPVPTMTYAKFAELVGVSEQWVAERVKDGEIPVMPKKGKQKPLINLALYWQIALSQPY